MVPYLNSDNFVIHGSTTDRRAEIQEISEHFDNSFSFCDYKIDEIIRILGEYKKLRDKATLHNWKEECDPTE